MRKSPLGQNFLVDPEITQKIIDLANIQPEDNIVEIGPGKAFSLNDLSQLSVH